MHLSAIEVTWEKNTNFKKELVMNGPLKRISPQELQSVGTQPMAGQVAMGVRSRYPATTPRLPLRVWNGVAVILTLWIALQSAATAQDQNHSSVVVFLAGELGSYWEKSVGGAQLQKIVVTSTEEVLVGPSRLFTIIVRDTATGATRSLSADSGWKHVDVTVQGDELTIYWSGPSFGLPETLRATLRVRRAEAISALIWQLDVTVGETEANLWEVEFPVLLLPQISADAVLLYPKAPGVAESGVWERPFHFGGRYPSGWLTMQLSAIYKGDGTAGVYLGIHDPLGSTKEMNWRSDVNSKTLLFSVRHPVPNMGRPNAEFHFPGNFVTRFFRGDWFDAAQIYRNWVEAEAHWFPQFGGDSRPDTPTWMKELPVWVLGGGAPRECVPAVLRFREFLEVPCGFHWYNWHQIPFDNDYPHYFPTKPGVAEGVEQLQAAGVHVMPYINGRLWDSRDKGTEDFEFSQIALPAATKNFAGEPFLETYGSKESDGSPVRLAVMCPTTALWQRKVAELVHRLFTELGTYAVYIDQVAAAAPTLCADPTHGHPLGGGHWWNEGYWQLLEHIRASMAPDRIITTECNAEPFIRWFDGYLTWHWQYDQQVPLFPAVYSGSIQMFGRWFDTPASSPSEEEKRNRDLSVRMRLGQALVFGEQLGWIGAGVLDEPDNAKFLRHLAHLRWQWRHFFSTGRMARPPKFTTPVPKVTADWKWQGKSIVTTDAVLMGQWVRPADKQVIILAVNVTEESQSASISANLGEPYVLGTVWKILGASPATIPLGTLEHGRWNVECTIPPLTAFVWHGVADKN